MQLLASVVENGGNGRVDQRDVVIEGRYVGLEMCLLYRGTAGQRASKRNCGKRELNESY